MMGILVTKFTLAALWGLAWKLVTVTMITVRKSAVGHRKESGF